MQLLAQDAAFHAFHPGASGRGRPKGRPARKGGRTRTEKGRGEAKEREEHLDVRDKRKRGRRGEREKEKIRGQEGEVARGRGAGERRPRAWRDRQGRPQQGLLFPPSVLRHPRTHGVRSFLLALFSSLFLVDSPITARPSAVQITSKLDIRIRAVGPNLPVGARRSLLGLLRS